jgi:hypothetical protein
MLQQIGCNLLPPPAKDLNHSFLSSALSDDPPPNNYQLLL